MAKSKPRKKYSPKRSLHNLVRAHANNLLVCSCSQDDFTRMYTTAGNRTDPPRWLADNLPQMAMPWATLAIIICRDRNGTEYIQSRPIVSNQEYTYETLAPTFGQHHIALKNEANQEHIIGFGWISSAKGTVVEDAFALKIMEQMGAFTGLAQWEQEKDSPD